jgi:thioredoxin 1
MNMKQVISLLFIGLMVLALTGTAEIQATAGSPGQTEAGTGSILVTFVELGSVRCIPCKKMQPIMEEIKKEYPDQVKVVFYDVWTPEGQPYARQYKIRLIPTQVFLDKDGNEYFRHEGFFPKEDLVKVLQQKGVK